MNEFGEIGPAKEVILHHDMTAIVDYERETQSLTTEKGQDGKEYIVSCDPPEQATVENREGFSYNREILNWKDFKLPEIAIGQNKLPLLTSQKEIGQETMEFLEHWYKDPTFVEKEIEKLHLPTLTKKPVDTLVVHYKNIRNDYWQQGENGVCAKVFDDQPENDPQNLFDQFSQTLHEYTEGAMDYKQVGMEVLQETDLPLTQDPEATYSHLLVAYKRTIDYRSIGKLAIKNGVSTVMVYAGPSAGMYESILWTDKETGKEIRIFGFNYERTYEASIHSWTHFLEDRIKHSPMNDIYLKCVGRDAEYGILPYLDERSNIKNENDMNNGKIYASMGLGTVHLAPNSIAHYQYDSEIPVLLPGHASPVNRTLWSGDEQDWATRQLNYCIWWLKSLPRPFLSALKG